MLVWLPWEDVTVSTRFVLWEEGQIYSCPLKLMLEPQLWQLCSLGIPLEI
jgi:hypothetical protein